MQQSFLERLQPWFADMDMAKDMLPAMIEAQSADVDTVTGATFSSTGIKNAAAQALKKAEK